MRLMGWSAMRVSTSPIILDYPHFSYTARTVRLRFRNKAWPFCRITTATFQIQETRRGICKERKQVHSEAGVDAFI
jgi:hypothetical protein